MIVLLRMIMRSSIYRCTSYYVSGRPSEYYELKLFVGVNYFEEVNIHLLQDTLH